jgi:hypothetical protein
MIVKSVSILPNQLEVVGPLYTVLEQGISASFTVSAKSQDFLPVPEGSTPGIHLFLLLFALSIDIVLTLVQCWSLHT